VKKKLYPTCMLQLLATAAAANCGLAKSHWDLEAYRRQLGGIRGLEKQKPCKPWAWPRPLPSGGFTVPKHQFLKPANPCAP
jgi:hypothetical protein